MSKQPLTEPPTLELQGKRTCAREGMVGEKLRKKNLSCAAPPKHLRSNSIDGSASNSISMSDTSPAPLRFTFKGSPFRLRGLLRIHYVSISGVPPIPLQAMLASLPEPHQTVPSIVAP
ncbi:hypothetical protein R3P38DRAFT_3198588 [Favolaschia claudopus]|uniref:Uncharacterized protein n=1 Tax=Favolaschia claudopus TaxID=2862362 RepID=A0AAW0B2P0_9AGAR